MHYCRRDSHATSRTPIYTNITQTGRIRVYCSWFWVVLHWFCWWFWVVLDGFGWFWLVPCFSNYVTVVLYSLHCYFLNSVGVDRKGNEGCKGAISGFYSHFSQFQQNKSLARAVFRFHMYIC